TMLKNKLYYHTHTQIVISMPKQRLLRTSPNKKDIQPCVIQKPNVLSISMPYHFYSQKYDPFKDK
ncbi:hypothetical protein, partial [Staphylococcus aureus]